MVLYYATANSTSTGTGRVKAGLHAVGKRRDGVRIEWKRRTIVAHSYCTS